MEEDEELKQLEEELKELESNNEAVAYGSPKPADKDNIFKFFREILKTNDTTRVANLDAVELGTAKLGVRHYKQLAAYADVEGLDIVGKYLREQGEILTSTSMSKKGFWAQLFVTQIKKEQKMASPQPVKKTWWGGNKPVENPQSSE